MPGNKALCSDDLLWHPQKARVGPSGQTAAAALQALGLPPPPAHPSPAGLFAARTLDGFAHEEPRARNPISKTLGLAAPHAPLAVCSDPCSPVPASPAATQRASSRSHPTNAALGRSPPKGQAPRSAAVSIPACADRPLGRVEHCAATAVQNGPLHAAQAACSTDAAGECRAASGEAAGAQPLPRGPAALQRYNGLSPAEAEALEHVHTAEGALLFQENQFHVHFTS